VVQAFQLQHTSHESIVSAVILAMNEVMFAVYSAESEDMQAQINLESVQHSPNAIEEKVCDEKTRLPHETGSTPHNQKTIRPMMSSAGTNDRPDKHEVDTGPESIVSEMVHSNRQTI
jgi:hypothetical protein